jgi:taurine dioxygenase
MTEISFRPLSPAFGVEVQGLDMSAPFAPEVADALSTALRDHHLLLVRGQAVTADDQRRFAKLFGDIVIRSDYDKAPDAEAETQHVSNARDDGILGTGELDFHIDQLFQEEPLRALILYAIEVPAEGGDTLFSSSTRAYEVLPEALKQRIASLSCLHLYDFKADYTKPQNLETATPGSPYAMHPMVYVDPQSGCRALWVNKNTTIKVVELEPDASAKLIHEVRRPLYDPQTIYRHGWRPGDLLIWNNRMLQHARTPFDPSCTRTLRRTPIG